MRNLVVVATLVKDRLEKEYQPGEIILRGIASVGETHHLFDDYPFTLLRGCKEIFCVAFTVGFNTVEEGKILVGYTSIFSVADDNCILIPYTISGYHLFQQANSAWIVTEGKVRS